MGGTSSFGGAFFWGVLCRGLYLTIGDRSGVDRALYSYLSLGIAFSLQSISDQAVPKFSG